MALRKRINVIDKSQIRTGQVLEIQYTDREGKSSKDLILVIDPKATAVANTGAGPTGVGQGRKGTLHAVKLKDLTERQLFDLIQEIRNLKNLEPFELSTRYRTSIYAEGLRNYRTYLHDSINRVSRVTLGQPAKQTNKIKIGNSVLYAVDHGKHVEIVPDEYPTFLNELIHVNGQIYFEGHEKAEDVALELIVLVGYTGPRPPDKSWEPTIEDKERADELYRITEIFGPSSQKFWEQLNEVKRNKDDTLVQVIEKWSDGRHSQAEIRDLVAMSNQSSATVLLDTSFNEVKEDTFLRFHLDMQNRAFANYGLTDEITEFTKKQEFITEIRQRSLIDNMKQNPGIYFAGYGHVDLLKRKGY